MSLDEPSLTVVVCTRGRPRQLHPTLDALTGQDGAFELVVVDQGSAPDPELERRAGAGELALVRDDGHGLSRARNLALARASTTWIAFVDDDCLVDPDFGIALRAALRRAPWADWVSGDVRAGGPAVDGLPVTTFPVPRTRTRSGRWTLPGRIGFGVMFCVRCSTARALGGWDERLGPGVEAFPAADDVDFNYRLLRSGGLAFLSPRVRARHEQWRSAEELPGLQRGYVRAWSGFAMKHLRGGDVAGGLWLWAWGVVDVLDMLESGLSRRSAFRLRLAGAKLRGLVEGTLAGAARRW